jgi:hypothetical protein
LPFGQSGEEPCVLGRVEPFADHEGDRRQRQPGDPALAEVEAALGGGQLPARRGQPTLGQPQEIRDASADLAAVRAKLAVRPDRRDGLSGRVEGGREDAALVAREEEQPLPAGDIPQARGVGAGDRRYIASRPG